MRAVFEVNLTNINDITIYARSNNSGSVQVYEKDSDVLLADFGMFGIERERKQILLTQLLDNYSQSTFDLKVSGGAVEFDQILDPTISACGTISSAGVYTLTQDISGTGTCITISASDVVLDGQGKRVTYGSAGTGVGVTATSVNNITIKHVHINKSTANVTTSSNYGIRFTTITNSTIWNVTIQTNGTLDNMGIVLISSSKFNNITANRVIAQGQTSTNKGIYLASSSNNNITSNTIITGGTSNNDGIRIYLSSFNNTYTSNIINNSNGVAILIDDVDGSITSKNYKNTFINTSIINF